MRRAWISILVIATFVCVSGCGQESQPADTSSAEAMLSLLPEKATGVFFVDLQRAVSIPAAQTALADQGEKLDEFIARTGVDPTRDVLNFACAITNQTPGEDGDGVAIMTVRVDQALMIAKLEENHGELTREDYEGITLFLVPSDSSKKIEKDAQLAFLGDGTVILGSPGEVRTVIDVHQGRAESVLKNEELMRAVNATNREAIFWAAFVFTEDEMRELTDGNPMLGKLSSIQSVVMSLDFENHTLLGVIECQSNREDQNQQIAEFLIGIKSFAAMGASEKPEFAEVLRAIEITSSAQNIRVTAAIPEELLQRLDASDKS